MDLTVYRQAYKVRPDGHTVYKGEDALPYVDEKVLIVADGLGGASAIRHQSFDRAMFDEEKLFDVLFKDVFEDEADVAIKEYVKKAFVEFLGIKDCYFDNINNVKKSGYFASRIVATIFLYLSKRLLLNPEENGLSVIFDDTVAMQEKAGILQKYSDEFTSAIGTMLKKVSENSNLIYESSFTGLALLGTTLCATIAMESEDFVDAIYFTSGDSRPYLWDESGLKQVSADQERADGGMTNYIKANGEFTINCEYKRFKKPCVLFNASDGVFDSKHFKVSQMAFEKLLLETVVNSDAIEDVGKTLETIFEDYGTHDDSSTIALKTYGYADMAELKVAAEKRLKEISDKYLSVMPDLLDHDYAAEINEYENARAAYGRTLANALFKNEKVAEYCKKLYLNHYEEDDDGRRVYVEAESALEKCKSEIGHTNAEILSLITKYILDNYNDTDSDPAEFDRLVKESAQEIADRLFNKELNVSDLILDENSEITLNELLENSRNLYAKLHELDLKRESVLAEEIKKFWVKICGSGEDVLKGLAEEGVLTEEEYREYLEKYPPYAAENKEETIEKAKKQKELLDIYDTTYNEMISGE